MPKKNGTKLDDRLVAALPLPERGMRMVFDSAVTGFGVRLTTGGARSYVVSYRVGSRERRYTIGDAKNWTCVAARKRAADIRAGARLGLDPLAELEESRGAKTMADLCDRFESEHFGKLRANSVDQYRRAIHGTADRKGLRAHFKNKPVAELTYSDVEAYHRLVSKTAPAFANRVMSVLSKMMTLAIRWGWATMNPVKSVERNHEVKRTRFLKDDEIDRLTAALDTLPDRQAASIFRLLLWTGARKTEVLTMKWSDLDLAAGVWTKPGSTTKQKTEHRVPLAAAAVELLRSINHRDPVFVFPGKVEGQPRLELKRQWARLCELADLPHGEVVIHTLRHSVASTLVSAGVSLPVVGALLGHSQMATTQRYAHVMDATTRAASEKVAALMGGMR